jgi:hypothetical protein
MQRSFNLRARTSARAVLALVSTLLVVACGDAAAEDATSGDESAVRGQCSLAPLSSRASRVPGASSVLPPFSAAYWTAAPAANRYGPWRLDAELSAPLSSPNRWLRSTGVLRLERPEAGAYSVWSLPIGAADSGKEFSIYVYVPRGATNHKAVFRVYRAHADASPLPLETDLTAARGGARVTLAGKTYTGENWVFLGRARLQTGAHVSLDGSVGDGSTAAGAVVAVRWGCAEQG